VDDHQQQAPECVYAPVVVVNGVSNLFDTAPDIKFAAAAGVPIANIDADDRALSAILPDVNASVDIQEPPSP